MNRKPLAGLLAMGLVAATTSATAATFEGGLLVNHLWLEADASEPTAKGFGASLDGIMLFNANDGVSLRLSRTSLEAGSVDADRDSVSVGYWRYLEGSASFRPYLNAAVGFGQVEAGAFEDDGVTLEGAVGLVSKWDVLIPGLKFRTELRLGWDDFAGTDYLLGVGAGLHYSFGGPAPTRAAPPVAAAAPAAVVVDGDSDGDGVANRADACQDTPTGAKVDARGCVDLSKFVLKGVSFNTASATLKNEASPTLDSAVAALKANPKVKVEVQGHTDSQGDAARNMTLSERRAQAVKSYLVKEGVGADRISVKGFGATQPVDDNGTAAGRANNRRVEFRVVAQ